MAAYDGWAEYYDLLHHGLPGDAAFYVEQALQAGGQTLELGVGTGRIALEMARAGVHLTGIDNSPAMLERCRAKFKAAGSLPGSVKLHEADLLDFNLGRQFDLVAIPYRAFMHLLTPEHQRQCLLRARKHMTDEGAFIMDSWVPRASAIANVIGGPTAEQLKLVGRYPVPQRETSVEHYQASTCDEFRQLITELHLIQEVDEHGTVAHEENLTMVRVWTTPRELEALLELCGFQVRSRYGDFEYGALEPGSSNAIWIAEKARA
ncbi:MAG: methyltransferase domain-containing protein [Nitrospiraceae bacterium]|nr:methyltransferase domain-containing protein [Nitrospiraceae bacterium]